MLGPSSTQSAVKKIENHVHICICFFTYVCVRARVCVVDEVH